MSAEYDDLDDLLDDEELQASILAKSPGSKENKVEDFPELEKLNLNNNLPGAEKPQSIASQSSSAAAAGAKPPSEQKKGQSPANDEFKSGSEDSLMSVENGGADGASRTSSSQLNEHPDVDAESEPHKAPTGSESFEDTIAATMDRLQKNQKPGSNDADDTDLLAQSLKEFQTDPDGPSASGFDGILGNLINELATKDVLYPPLKEMHENFGPWMQKNAATLDKEELARFTKQRKIVAEVVAKFEAPDYSDKNSEHRSFITDKMAEMQETGAPPPDLTDGVAGGGFPGMGLGDNSAPDLPADCTTQ